MSTRYFIICLDCKRKISIADRSFHGKCLTPEAKRELPKFVITHVDHKIRLVSEYDEMMIEYRSDKDQKGTRQE
jgi:hypothetical protein